ncbi:putative PilS domain-containing protein [Vibrio chagasii]|nr:putative PilS domain-containing protein [Vibrio chagasii]
MKISNRTLGHKKSGFTMIELMLVIVIGVGLGALAIPRFMDTKNMNDAREEASKLSEFKSAIDSMYQRTIDYSTLDGIYQQIAPSSFENDGTIVRNIWKNVVTVEGAEGSYEITHQAVPDGRVCQEFIRGTQSQGWVKIDVDGASVGDGHPADADPAQIIGVCGGGTTASGSTVDITFTFDVSGSA